MKSFKNNIIGIAVVVAALAITAAISFSAGRSGNEDDMTDLRDSLSFLLSEQKEAYVVKRVSEQMGEIASQQRMKAEAERERAEEQARLADENAARAEQESRAAREAEGRAVAFAQEADNERAEAELARQDAIREKDVAELAKAITDTVNYRSLGRALGSSSMTVREAKQETLSNQLAYASWYYLDRYKGNKYVSQSYRALSRASGQMLSTKLPNKALSIELSTVPGEVGKCVAATSNGEIYVLTRDGDWASASNKLLMQNTKYDFHDVWAGRNAIYAVTANGPLCEVSYSGTLKERPLPADLYLKLEKTDANRLVVFGKKSVSWYNLQSASVEKTVNYGSDYPSLSTAVFKNDVACLFFEDGKFAEMSPDGKIVLKTNPVAEVARERGVKPIVTAAHYDAKTGCLVVGLKDGVVFPINYDYRVMEKLAAHTGPCTCITMVGNTIVTTSYDQSAYIWSMDYLMFDSGLNFEEELKTPRAFKGRVTKPNMIATEWLVPVQFSGKAWMLSTCADGDGKSVWLAGSHGTVTNASVSPDDMAARVYKKLDSNMKESDWKRYVGVTIPYVRFK